MHNGINVFSEIGMLKTVLVHRPGNELLNLTPDTLEQLLFDDIPFLKVAQKEHDAFVSLMRNNGIEVVYLEDLMSDVLDLSDDIKKKFIDEFIAEGCTDRRYHDVIRDYLNSLDDNKDVVMKTMEGIKYNELELRKEPSLADLTNDTNNMLVPPMPNLYFTRDPFASIGNSVSIHRMFFETRRRETIYGHYIFEYHPALRNVKKLYQRNAPYHIEGGDILNLNSSTIAIGISQRTEANAIDFLGKHIFEDENSPINDILAFAIPKNRSFMHLDTVFTQIDYDKFTVHPGIMGELTVYRLHRQGRSCSIDRLDCRLEDILAQALGIDKVTLIRCGGNDLISAQREQWNDGSNTLCLSPGKILVYERNEITNSLLRSYGIEVLTMLSSELSRGRGGPRCMSMPLWREDI